MATTFDHEGEPVVDLRLDIILLDGELRQRTCDVKPRQGIGAGVYGSRLGKYHVHEALENLELPPQRAVGGGGDFRLELAELGGGEARLPGKRLTVNERCIERRSHQFLAMLGGDLDEIPQHVVCRIFSVLMPVCSAYRACNAAMTRRDSSRSARASSRE